MQPKRALVLVGVLAFLAVACGQDAGGPPRVDPDAEVGSEPPGRQFFFDPASYVNQDVTVSGYVSGILTPVAFRVAGERFEGPGLLVVSDEPLDVDEGDLVQIDGTVRWFAAEAFARDLGVTLDPAIFHEFEGDVAIAARQVTVGGIR